MPCNTKKMSVGGQAVIEGVMMRSPNSLAIAVRRQDGTIVLKERKWEAIWTKYKFMRWPVFRGSVMLIESLVNGVQALTFSADQAMIEEDSAKEGEDKGEDKGKDEGKDEKKEEKKEEKPISRWMLYGTVAFSLAFAFLVFKGVPHLVTTLIGTVTSYEISTNSALFHIIDGVIKTLMFIAYIWGVSFMSDMRRVFQYHGAEHKCIYAYEAGEALTVENARKYTTLHPRCGTSFIILVLMVSILVFMVVFSFLPVFYEGNRWINALLQIAVKLPLMLPIAGLAYELIRVSGKYPNAPILRWCIKPGLWMQKITTREPDDDMLEVALISLRKSLWRERHGMEGLEENLDEFEIFENYESVHFEGEPEMLVEKQAS